MQLLVVFCNVFVQLFYLFPDFWRSVFVGFRVGVGVSVRAVAAAAATAIVVVGSRRSSQ